MVKKKRDWLPQGRVAGWYDDNDKYHPGNPPKSRLKKLFREKDRSSDE